MPSEIISVYFLLYDRFGECIGEEIRQLPRELVDQFVTSVLGNRPRVAHVDCVYLSPRVTDHVEHDLYGPFDPEPESVTTHVWL